MAFQLPDTLAWHDGFLLGHPALDVEHASFVRCIDALGRSADDALPAALEALAACTRDHFAYEERRMTDTGFPARACHADEHAAVLRSIEGVQRRVAAGDLASARRLARALADWFPGHADYLDAPLAHWLCGREHGGRPVVLRRRATARG